MHNLDVRIRSLLVVCFDICAVIACWVTAYSLRFNFALPDIYMESGLFALIWVVPIHALLFRVMGLYRGIWVFASLPDLMRILRAIALSAVLVIVITVMIGPTPPVPRSVYVISPLMLVLAMGGSRAAYRVWRERQRYGALMAAGKPVLLLGAGAAGLNVAREMRRSAEWRLVAILDDNPHKHGRELMGYKVVGGLDQLGHWARVFKARHAIVAMPSATPAQQKRALVACMSAHVKAQVVRRIGDMMSQDAGLASLREVELEDLLGRDPVKIDSAPIGDMLQGRTILVTGAGGSIGSELCRQIARFAPARIVAFEANEFALYRLSEDFARQYPDVPIAAIVGDVRDPAWLDATFARHQPDVVFHAAAYKHVPMMEEHNAWQAIRNNVLGTWRVANAAVDHGVARFVMVSTDKAVNPTNVMGATKRLAEMLCQDLQTRSDTTRFECVRFGNVLGSAGSVVPKFQDQIARGGPVTVTHPEITRYFMSIPEACQLVLQAAAMGERGEIFVLDMGEPVKIVDLARVLIALAGATEEQIPIVYSGLRPGEKLYEELLADDEHTRATHHPKLRIAKARGVDAALVAEVIAWLEDNRVRSQAEVKQVLRRWVPEYQPPTPVKVVPVTPDRRARA
ncbi:MAG: nucleoside-diphosphate sugar epimerase/dehydratase [Rhodocyclaceae bacterium]